jgi:BirA family biotin operon repressor/biotin-[acetyl-CoA-carboxylase] ligase
MTQNFENLAGNFSVIGSRITRLGLTTSTMDIAWDLVRVGVPDGTVVIADRQSAGRGRHDRSWMSEPGKDILCSVVLLPRVALAGELLMLAALAVVDVGEFYGIDAGIKWPNDVQVRGKKLAGVIAESKTGPDGAGGTGDQASFDGAASGDFTAVMGIGLNVNFDPRGRADTAPESTSLAVELGRDVDRYEAFSELLGSLDRRYAAITAGGTVLPDWREKLTTLGREVTIVGGASGSSIDLHGIAQDVDSMGRLIVRDENGRDWPVAAGEVTVRDIK